MILDIYKSYYISTSTIIIENIDSGGSLQGFTITNGYGQVVSFEDFISMAADQELLDILLTILLLFLIGLEK